MSGEEGALPDLERYLLGSWSVVTVLLGGVGNVLLLAAVHLRHFKIDNTSLWFIVNMSVADLLYILTMVLPSVPSNFSNRWLFGTVLCAMSCNFSSWYAIAHLLSLTLLSLNKLLRCMFPLRSVYSKLSKRAGTLIILVMWIVAGVPTVEYYVLDRGSHFDTSINRCFIPKRPIGQSIWLNLDRMNFLLFSAAPLLLIIICNVGLIVIVLKNARVVQKTTIIMIISMSFLLLTSWLPVTIYAVASKQKHFVFWRVVNYMIPVDMTLCPLTYCYFNESFRDFVRNKLRCGTNRSKRKVNTITRTTVVSRAR